jgi:SAM-dependent methyltransferase
MTEHVIPFKPHRFESAAAHYLAGRPAYSPTLIRRVADRVGLRPPHRVLDLGCGPGQLAGGFAYFAGAVLGMDPEPEMLAIAAGRAEGVLPNVSFVQGSSYDLGPDIGARFGPFRLAAIGRAFHWMDRADVLRRLDPLIEAGGAVALFSDQHPGVRENEWVARLEAIRETHADGARPSWRQPGWPKHEVFLLDSPFSQLERIGVIERRELPPQRILDRVLSMSSCSRAELGARAAPMEAEVRALIDSLAQAGPVVEVVESTALIASRPA